MGGSQWFGNNLFSSLLSGPQDGGSIFIKDISHLRFLSNVSSDKYLYLKDPLADDGEKNITPSPGYMNN